VWVTSSLATILTPTAAALGNFDGVHRGHRQVIQPILQQIANPDIYPTVVTFHPHPQEFFSGQPRCLLTPLAEKVAQLAELGVEQLVLLPFDRELANLTPQEFVADLLVEKLQAKQVSVGMDFCFGRQRSGTALDLQQLATAHGIRVNITSLQRLEGDRISSSAIRQALERGEVSFANHLLGRSYRLVGQVVPGQQRGRQLGFPTANLHIPGEKFLPRLGVYAVRIHHCQDTRETELLTPPSLTGVMNLGIRPTVDGSQQTAEVHLFDWSGDLYGQTLAVYLEKFLRPEQKFASLETLQRQIAMDCQTARKWLGLL